MERLPTKETIIYGGAFNPPTLAHVAILNACISYATENDADVWVVPSGTRSDKTITVPREMRIAYLEAMINDAETSSFVEPQIITTELDRDALIETYDTVQELKGMHPQREFRFVFGADSTETMASWSHGDKLLAELPMLVVEREGSRINPLARRAVRLNVTTPNVSSTEVRQRLACDEPIDALVSRSVHELISAKSLAFLKNQEHNNDMLMRMGLTP